MDALDAAEEKLKDFEAQAEHLELAYEREKSAKEGLLAQM